MSASGQIMDSVLTKLKAVVPDLKTHRGYKTLDELKHLPFAYAYAPGWDRDSDDFLQTRRTHSFTLTIIDRFGEQGQESMLQYIDNLSSELEADPTLGGLCRTIEITTMLVGEEAGGSARVSGQMVLAAEEEL